METQSSSNRDISHRSNNAQPETSAANAPVWSGIGQKYDVDYKALGPKLRAQLMNGTPLGDGASGTVQRVVCDGIPLARKSIRTPTAAILKAVKAEIEALRNLSGHHHIVSLEGTYLTTDHGLTTYHILTSPVADCDMNIFLNHYEACTHGEGSDLNLERLLQAANVRRLNLSQGEIGLTNFLKVCLGSTTKGIKWMHDAGFSHDDIKPANILLRGGEVYLTDFGITRDRRNAEDTSTETYVGTSYGWSAPEKGERHNPFLSDVYSLGCFFMHVITVISSAKRRKDCSDILQSPPQHREHYIQEHFSPANLPPFSDGSEPSSYNLVDLTIAMLHNDYYSRPSISDVDAHLLSVAGSSNVFHGSCCGSSNFTTAGTNSTPTSDPTPSSFFAPPVYRCDRVSCRTRTFSDMNGLRSHLMKKHNISKHQAKKIAQKSRDAAHSNVETGNSSHSTDDNLIQTSSSMYQSAQAHLDNCDGCELCDIERPHFQLAPYVDEGFHGNPSGEPYSGSPEYHYTGISNLNINVQGDGNTVLYGIAFNDECRG